MAESQPAGCRLVFDTRATEIELEALRTRPAYRGMPMRPDGVYDLVVDGELTAHASLSGGNVLMKDATAGTEELIPGAPSVIRFADLPDRHKTVEIWLPHNEITELIALRSDRPLEASPISRPVWLHHGSSISHGSNAVRPTGTWPAVAAARADVELVNLGMGGAAMLDPFTARTMRDIPADLISVKIGINIVNADLMRVRAFGPAVHGFLDTIRDGHPTTPIIVVSAVHCPIHEHTPGPLAPDFSGEHWLSPPPVIRPKCRQASSRSASSATSSPVSSANARPPTRICATSTDSTFTGRPISPSSRLSIGCIRGRELTNVWGSASPPSSARRFGADLWATPIDQYQLLVILLRQQ